MDIPLQYQTKTSCGLKHASPVLVYFVDSWNRLTRHSMSLFELIFSVLVYSIRNRKETRKILSFPFYPNTNFQYTHSFRLVNFIFRGVISYNPYCIVFCLHLFLSLGKHSAYQPIHNSSSNHMVGVNIFHYHFNMVLVEHNLTDPLLLMWTHTYNWSVTKIHTTISIYFLEFIQ